MRLVTLAALATVATSVCASKVQIEVTRAVECDRKTKRGDNISVHYKGTLQADGSEFDASYKRGQPLSFTVGQGQVIKGWDDNLLDMCIGEKRTLTIPPEFGYGNSNMGPIPAGSTLIFETELMGIDGVKAPEKIVEKKVEAAKDTVESAADKATEGVKEAIKNKVADAAEAVKVVLADSDGDGQEHNEL
ncbi:probable peptidylprolyl isomerase [Rhynchosporium graminicola]|uniref:peptidylprolyl isomerase n=1 Tax=Rhynchosporium graminicola TaxID=2792576 RepID=A0A1E1LM35_9HELO|nr:probable peptidylprolyl isomerase [Rhynchosporium commune]